MLEGDSVIQRHLDRLKKWADSNLMQLNREQNNCIREKKKTRVSVHHDGIHPSGKMLGRKGPGEHQAENKPATCPQCKES